MKTITIDSDAYKMLVGKLDRIYDYVQNCSDKKDISTVNPDDVWIDNEEAIVMLECSGRTLQRLRSKSQVSYCIRKNKVYYSLSEIRRLMIGRIVPGKPRSETDLIRSHQEYQTEKNNKSQSK